MMMMTILLFRRNATVEFSRKLPTAGASCCQTERSIAHAVFVTRRRRTEEELGILVVGLGQPLMMTKIMITKIMTKMN